jgi:flagellar biosynthesis/type III secretory pathway protein FliH
VLKCRKPPAKEPDVTNPDLTTAEQGAALAKAELAAQPDIWARAEYIADELSARGKERAREMTEGATEAYHQGFEAALEEASA